MHIHRLRLVYVNSSESCFYFSLVRIRVQTTFDVNRIASIKKETMQQLHINKYYVF